MHLTFEMILTVAMGVLSGAMMAWLGNRIVNAELLGHVKRHCEEIDQAIRLAERAHEKIGDHANRLAVIEYQHRIDRGGDRGYPT